MTVIVFAGQGSQFPGMGRELFSRYPALGREASDVLGYDLVDLCLNGKREQLRLTRYAQPAIFVYGALAWRRRQEEGAPEPAAVAGLSLGELDALHAAGVFDFTTGVRIVAKRAELMSTVEGGSVAAVLGLSPRIVRRLAEQHPELHELDVANYNSWSQTAVAGPVPALERSVEIFKGAGASRVVLLEVSAPFHSRYMKPAADEFARFLEGFTFREPSLPVLSNHSALPHDPAVLPRTLGRQIDSPVRWVECIEYLLRQGHREFEEIGPGPSQLLPMVADIRRTSAFAS